MISPQITEIDYQDPLKLFTYFGNNKGTVFFDSVEPNTTTARYSFIALDPFQTIMSKNNQTKINNEISNTDPFTVLQQAYSQYQLGNQAELPPFQGGVTGYFGYELNQHLEKLPSTKQDDRAFPDCVLGFYDLVLGFDHDQQRAWLFSSGYPEQEPSKQQQRAKQRSEIVLAQIEQAQQQAVNIPSLVQDITITSNFTRADYEAAVQKVIDYIYAGDIFQANISQRFSAQLPENLSALQLYLRLRQFNKAPFAAFVNAGDTVIASASPERFIKLTDKKVETCPIKGTRPRSLNPSEDKALAEALQNSEKDQAENTMIVDLMRNDISKVCAAHSVNVPELCELKSFSNVHHLVSKVHGELKPNYNAVDLLRACFPGGSITGAPKVRAMEIIAECEPDARGPYCGSIAYLGFNGSMDSSVAIRTYAIKGREVSFHAGGAVVADSDPAAEYEESLAKVTHLQRALMRD